MHISAEGLNASCNASFTQLSDTDTEITKSTSHLHQSFGNAAVFNLVSITMVIMGYLIMGLLPGTFGF